MAKFLLLVSCHLSFVHFFHNYLTYRFLGIVFCFQLLLIISSFSSTSDVHFFALIKKMLLLLLYVFEGHVLLLDNFSRERNTVPVT